MDGAERNKVKQDKMGERFVWVAFVLPMVWVLAGMSRADLIEFLLGVLLLIAVAGVAFLILMAGFALVIGYQNLMRTDAPKESDRLDDIWAAEDDKVLYPTSDAKADRREGDEK